MCVYDKAIRDSNSINRDGERSGLLQESYTADLMCSMSSLYITCIVDTLDLHVKVFSLATGPKRSATLHRVKSQVDNRVDLINNFASEIANCNADEERARTGNRVVKTPTARFNTSDGQYLPSRIDDEKEWKSRCDCKVHGV